MASVSAGPGESSRWSGFAIRPRYGGCSAVAILLDCGPWASVLLAILLDCGCGSIPNLVLFLVMISSHACRCVSPRLVAGTWQRVESRSGSSPSPLSNYFHHGRVVRVAARSCVNVSMSSRNLVSHVFLWWSPAVRIQNQWFGVSRKPCG